MVQETKLNHPLKDMPLTCFSLEQVKAYTKVMKFSSWCSDTPTFPSLTDAGRGDDHVFLIKNAT